MANANQKLEKQDLQALQERQEATQIVAEMGAKAVGDLAKMMNWEDGSPQKIALHGLIGYLSAKVGGGNTAASTLSAMGSEYINTEIANYLQENTALTADQRNAIQQASAAGLGALIGASLGGDSNTVNQSAQMAWRTEKFNRQLHPEEKQRIKDLANGDKEKEARLTAAACALVHCSAQIPSDDPEYAKAKALEDLGNSAEFASERALLSKQVGTIGDDAFAASTLKPMFNYNNVYRAKDYDDANLQVLTRVGGAAQLVGGVAATVFGVGICETGMGCVGGVPIAAYGVDNAVAGARTIYSGKYHSTIGATALADLTGINPETAELIYSSPSMVFGVKPIVMGAAKATGAVANEVARVGGDVKYVAGELGKDVKVGATYINNTGAIITRNLNNAIENTGTKKFGLGVVGGGVGELVVESRSYSEGKKDITPTNLIGTANNILKSGLTGGITANTNTLQALGINTVSSITLKNQSGNEAFKENIISSSVGSALGYRGFLSEPLSGSINSILTDEAKKKLEKYSNKGVE